MTSRGPFQPKTFYDSMILKDVSSKDTNCLSQEQIFSLHLLELLILKLKALCLRKGCS